MKTAHGTIATHMLCTLPESVITTQPIVTNRETMLPDEEFENKSIVENIYHGCNQNTIFCCSPGECCEGGCCDCDDCCDCSGGDSDVADDTGCDCTGCDGGGAGDGCDHGGSDCCDCDCNDCTIL